jgi:hypothetical protein
VAATELVQKRVTDRTDDFAVYTHNYHMCAMRSSSIRPLLKRVRRSDVDVEIAVRLHDGIGESPVPPYQNAVVIVNRDGWPISLGGGHLVASLA